MATTAKIYANKSFSHIGVLTGSTSFAMYYGAYDVTRRTTEISGNSACERISFSFQPTDMSFLNLARIQSAKLIFPLYSVEGTECNLVFSAFLESLASCLTGSLFRQPQRTDVEWPYVRIPTSATQLVLPTTGNISISNIVLLLTNGGQLWQDLGSTPNQTIKTRSVNSGTPPYLEIVYDLGDSEPPTTSPKAPIYDVVNGNEPVTFEWNYAQCVNASQTHFELEVNYTGTWEPLKSKTAAVEQKCVIAKDVLRGGNALWRCRVYTKNGTVASEWSNPASVFVRRRPDTPNIVSLSGKPRLAATWTAAAQEAFHFRCNGYDAGVVYGMQRTLTLPLFLPDGSVTAQVSVANAQGLWSYTSTAGTEIKNISREDISVTLACKKSGVSAAFAANSAYTSLYFLRDGIPIARLPGAKEGAFFDALSLGKHKYKIRGDQGNGYYTDSPEQIAVVRVPCGMLSAVDEIDWIPMRLRAGEPPSHDADIAADVSFVHYQGRTRPVSYSMGFLTKTHTLSYTFRTREEYQKLEALVGKTVVYKDVLGDSFIGTFTSVTPGYSRRVDFTITITETDYTQEVAYE